MKDYLKRLYKAALVLTLVFTCLGAWGQAMAKDDEKPTAKALGFMEKAVEDDKPFFVWWNSTRMHVYTHLKPESEGKTGLGI